MQALKGNLLIKSIYSHEMQFAVEKNGQLIEFHIRKNEGSILGNIYLARIKKIKRSVNAAIVELDNGLFGFLSFSDIHQNYQKAGLKLEQCLIVQITREAKEEKLANCSTYVDLIGKYCVYSPYAMHSNGVSRNITGESKTRVKEALKELSDEAAVIVRTAASSASIEEITTDYKRLKQSWKFIQHKAKTTIGILHVDEPLLQVLRKYSNHSIQNVIVDNRNLYDNIKKYIAKNKLAINSVTYSKDDIFAEIMPQIEALYKHELALKSGGNIIFNYGHALIAIDVNSKKYHKEKNIENTAYKINMEAAEVIYEQIILRNLGGIIAIDFIDMKHSEHIDEVNHYIKSKLKDDKSATKFLPLNKFGVALISRQRLGGSVIDQHYQPCERCNTFGFVLKNQSVIFDILSKIKYLNACKVTTNWKNMQELLNNYNHVFSNKRIMWELQEGFEYKVEELPI